jgi:hypothetical protein
MSFRNFLPVCNTVASLLAMVIVTSPIAGAQSEYLAFSFPRATNSSMAAGCLPQGNLVADGSGNLYGTTESCGVGGGTVFELARPIPPNKVWTEVVLYSFPNGGFDARVPRAGVVFDAAGNLYGTTTSGGTSNLGAVFELTAPSIPGGQWTESVLHSFVGGLTDGASPSGGVVLDNAGNLYGVTLLGGSGRQEFDFCMQGCGIAYKLTRPATQGADWTETIIHKFTAKKGAIFPSGTPIFDASGSLYGGTSGGTAIGHSLGAAAYRITPPANGDIAWIYKMLYGFPDVDGPEGSLTFRNGGRLYGTTPGGGQFMAGSVFELVPPPPGGVWTENVLFSFNGVPNDGFGPFANITFDNVGNIYGTTQYGGSGPEVCLSDSTSCGTVFKLTKPTTEGGDWTETILHSFGTTASDGLLPSGGVLYWKNGVLFGVTSGGGRGKEGAIYGIVP